MSQTNEKYWAEYTGLQKAKHQLLGKYLVPRQINYVDVLG
jgi:hypothetical protein